MKKTVQLDQDQWLLKILNPIKHTQECQQKKYEKKIAIFTTRGDMAVLTPLIKRLKKEKNSKLIFLLEAHITTKITVSPYQRFQI